MEVGGCGCLCWGLGGGGNEEEGNLKMDNIPGNEKTKDHKHILQ